MVKDIGESLIIRICAIYRPSSKWEHESYYVSGQIYHGTRKIGRPMFTQACTKQDRDQMWPSRIIFDTW